MSIFLNFSGKTFILEHQNNIHNEIIHFFEKLCIDSQNISLKCNGKPLQKCVDVLANTTIWANIQLLGGKGGYGAKLKSEGGKKVRPNDNRFSRDAQGRRIEYQMAERQYTQFIKKKMYEDQKVNQQRQQFRVMQQTMKEGNSFMKIDKKYNQELEATQTKLAHSIRIGRQKLIQKMRLQKQNSEEKKQKLSESRYEDEGQQKKQMKKDSLIVQKEEQKQDKQIEVMQKPIKKVKSDNLQVKQVKVEKPQFFSAKDKLKSLFKK